MFNIIVVWFIGLSLLYAEFFFPGGVLTLMAAACMIWSYATFIGLSPDYFTLLGISFIALISILLVVKVSLWQIASGQEDSVMLQATQEGFYATSYDASLIGLQALAVSDLKPAGYIHVNNLRLNALSQGEFIAQGTRVKIIGGEGANLIVSSTN